LKLLIEFVLRSLSNRCFVCVCITHTHTHAHTRTHTNIHIHTYMHASIYLHTLTQSTTPYRHHIHTYLHTITQTTTPHTPCTYTPTYTHTKHDAIYIHIHTHTYTPTYQTKHEPMALAMLARLECFRLCREAAASRDLPRHFAGGDERWLKARRREARARRDEFVGALRLLVQAWVAASQTSSYRDFI